MRYSKPVLTVLVVLMILSLNFSAAGAQGGEPDGQVDASDPVPIFPTGDFTFKKTPIFQFTEDPSAIKYEIKVSNYTTGVLLYTFKGPPNCSPGGKCSLGPTYELSLAIRSKMKGFYSWVVRSKRGDGSWSPPSAPAGFVILKKEVYSTFDTLDSKWSGVSGDWSVTDAGYLKTKGEIGQMSSTIEKHLFSSLGLLYEVNMRRKVENESPNFLWFLGDPEPPGLAHMWDDGYMLVYNNNGDWELGRRQNGSSLTLASGVSSYFTSEWNKLTIWRTGSEIVVWINGYHLVTRADSAFNLGYVGIGMMEVVEGASPLLVDSVRVWYSPTPPYPLY